MSAVLRRLNAASLTDEDVVGLTWEGRLVWAYLPCYADSAGRLDDKPISLRMEMLPNNPEVDMEEIFTEFARLRFINRYEKSGKKYIQIRNWLKYQRPYKGESPSKRPGPDDPDDFSPGSPLEDPLDIPLDLPLYSIGKKEEEEEKKSNSSYSNQGGVGGNHKAPEAPEFEIEPCWQMVRAKWSEAGFYPGWQENWTAAKKKFQAKIDFRNWPYFWQGLCWAVETSKQSGERQYLGVLCTFLNEAKWKDQEPPDVFQEEKKKPVDPQTANASMGY